MKKIGNTDRKLLVLATALLFWGLRWRKNVVVLAAAPRDRDVPMDQYVWFTAVRSLVTNKFVCSGSWIGSRYVLTAAHCFRPNLKVQIGYWCRHPDNCGRQEEEIIVDGVYTHSSAQLGFPGGDSAILILRHAVQTIKGKPAIPYLGPTLDPWTVPLRKGRKMIIVGAGRSAVSVDDVSVNIKKLKVKFVRQQKCQQRIVSFNLASFEVCSKPINGSPCPGDSGSGLVVRGKGKWKGRDVILGVHNLGPSTFTACSDTVKNRVLVHFDMTTAVDFVRSRVCDDDFLEDWCEPPPTEEPTPSSSSSPTSSPQSVPTVAPSSSRPTFPPTFLPTPLAGNPTEAPTAAPLEPFGSTLPPTVVPALVSTPTTQPVIPHQSTTMSPTATPAPTPLVAELTQTILHSFERHSGTVYSVSFSSDGSRLVSGGAGSADLMNVWRPLLGGGAFPVFMNASSTVFAAQWNPLSDVIAAGFADGRVRLWNVGTPDEATIDLGGADMHTDVVRSVAWHPDGNLLISGSYDCTVRIWDAMSQTQVGAIAAHSDRVRSVSFRPDGSQFASASDDTTIKLWRSSAPFSLVRTLRGHSKAVREVAYSPNGRFLASASLDGSVKVWRVSNGRLIHEFMDISKVWMLCVAWSPDGKYIVSGSADGLLRVWDAEEGGAAPLLVLKGHFNGVWSVEWSPDGLHIASGSTDAIVLVWKIEPSS